MRHYAFQQQDDPPWGQIVLELRSSGMTYANIGHAIGASRTLPENLVKGTSTQPRWRPGNRLLRLYDDRIAKRNH